MLSTVRAVSLREQVVDQIRTAIIEARLKPGDHITEITLTQQLGVSRTPVREALILLEREGLVSSTPNKGCFVRAFTVQDVHEIFTLRTVLENFAAQLYMPRLTDSDTLWLQRSINDQHAALSRNDLKSVRTIDMAFHEFIVTNARHEMLIRNWREIVAQIAAVLYLRADAIADYDETQSIRDHTAIVAAYTDHDLPRLVALNERINARVSAECERAVGTLLKPNVKP